VPDVEAEAEVEVVLSDGLRRVVVVREIPVFEYIAKLTHQAAVAAAAVSVRPVAAQIGRLQRFALD
jgi:hypothetical protein